MKRRAVIFAGGKSSRMGKDKSLLPFGKYKSLAEYQYRRMTEIFDQVYISAKNEKFIFECNVICDNYSENSPLVGLVSIFEHLKCDEVFVLSVDTPFVDASVIERLYTATFGFGGDAIVATSPHGTEPLCGIYRETILPHAYALLKSSNHRLNALLEHIHCNYVPFEEEKYFANLNFPEQYEEARKRML